MLDANPSRASGVRQRIDQDLRRLGALVIAQRGKRLRLVLYQVVRRCRLGRLVRRDERYASIGGDRRRQRERPRESRADQILHVLLLRDDRQVEPLLFHHREQAPLPRAAGRHVHSQTIRSSTH